MKTIVFQGDSITDCGREEHRGSTESIGQGYAMLVAAKLGFEQPGEYTFVNRGISGNRVVDVYARIKADCWNHNPDVLSLLVGINDVWHEVSSQNGVDVKRFKKVYSMLVEDTIERFPNIQMLLLEPFVLKGAATEENWNTFYTGACERAEVVRSIAEQYKQIFVPLQKKFDEAQDRFPQPFWIKDGVHPTPAGHQLIANAWLEAYCKYIK